MTAKEFYNQQLHPTTSVSGRLEENEIIDLMEAFAKQSIAERMPTECKTCNELGHPCWLHDPTNPDNNKRMPTEEAERWDAEGYLNTKDIWNHPMVSDRINKNGYEVADLMAEFANKWFRSRMEEKK
jgi:hypothetical protein